MNWERLWITPPFVVMRVFFRTTLDSSSRRFTSVSSLILDNPVTLPPGRARLAANAMTSQRRVFI